MLVGPPSINYSGQRLINQIDFINLTDSTTEQYSVLNRGWKSHSFVSLRSGSQLKVLLWHIVINLAEVSTWVAEMILFRWFEHKDIANKMSRAFHTFANQKSQQPFTIWLLLKFAVFRFCSFAVFPPTHQVVFKNANILLMVLFARISVAKSWLLGSVLGPGFSAWDITFGGFKSEPVNWLIDGSNWKARIGDCITQTSSWRKGLADLADQMLIGCWSSCCLHHLKD